MDRKSVIVIGGGPAGMLAAATAGSRGLQVTLIEQNSKDDSSVHLGRKLCMTGNGRCNVTNHTDVIGLIAKVVSNGKFLYSAFQHFSAQDTVALLHRYGVMTKTEQDGKVFPESDRSLDVVEALRQHMSENHVKTEVGMVKEIRRNESGKFTIYFDNVHGNDVHGNGLQAQHLREFDAVIVATGGKSYPKTGSTGDGYRWAASFGHPIIPLRAALVSVILKEQWIQQLQGISLPDVEISLQSEQRPGKRICKIRGDVMFTHYGITGPAVYMISSHMKDCENSQYTLEMDCLPGISREELQRIIEKEMDINSKRQIIKVLQGILPKNMILVLLNYLQICYDRYANQITSREREKIIETIKKLHLSVHRLRPLAEATVTSGGIDVKTVHPGTMESKLVEGLFFAGEILDVDGYTGGFNIQIALSTGYVAGSYC